MPRCLLFHYFATPLFSLSMPCCCCWYADIDDDAVDADMLLRWFYYASAYDDAIIPFSSLSSPLLRHYLLRHGWLNIITISYFIINIYYTYADIIAEAERQEARGSSEAEEVEMRVRASMKEESEARARQRRGRARQQASAARRVRAAKSACASGAAQVMRSRRRALEWGQPPDWWSLLFSDIAAFIATSFSEGITASWNSWLANDWMGYFVISPRLPASHMTFSYRLTGHSRLPLHYFGWHTDRLWVRGRAYRRQVRGSTEEREGRWGGGRGERESGREEWKRGERRCR